LLLLPGAGRAVAAALDEAGEAAAALLRQAATPQQNAAHEALLESLRRLNDPTLRPFFEALAAAPQASLQLHGLLGIAQLDPSHELPISAIGEMDHAPLQAELIAAAMDEDLLPTASAQQLLNWPGLALPVKLVVATRLLETEQFDRPNLLVDALKSEKLGQRALAALLLHQLNDPRGTAALAEVDRSTKVGRDAVRSELLRTAVRHKFHRVADWALGVAMEPGVDEKLAWSGLATALRFGQPSAAAKWKALYESHAGNAAQQRLLALMLLRVAPFVDARAFDALLSSGDALVAEMGRTGKAIASDAPDLADRAGALLKHAHPMVNNWALSYAERDARPDVAQLVLLSLIAAYETGSREDRLERLDDAAQAARLLMEIDPATGGDLLRPILTQATDPRLQQAILLGLLRVEAEGVSAVVEGVTLNDTEAHRLALVLRARDEATLGDKEMADLRWIVRGATKIQGTLRIQAAWVYLKRTNQIDAAVQRALQP